MKNIILTLFSILIVTAIFPIEAMAQGAPPATPIDGGLSLLLAAGGAYGVKKVLDKRKQDK